MVSIQLYIILSLIVNLVTRIVIMLPENHPLKYLPMFVFNISSIFEMAFIYLFLYSRVSIAKFRMVIMSLFITYLLICLALWILKTNSIFSFAPVLFGIQSIFIAIPSLFFIYEILKSDFDFDLKADSNFIIACGILFYYSISIPIFFGWYNLFYIAPEFTKILVFSNFIFATLLIISFIKAYLCLKQE